MLGRSGDSIQVKRDDVNAGLDSLACSVFTSAPLTSIQFCILLNRAEDSPRDVVGSYAFALRCEVGDDAVTEDRQRDGGDVFGADVILAGEHGAGFGAEDQVQAGARPGTPREPLLTEI